MKYVRSSYSNRSGSNLYHSSSHGHVSGIDHECREGKPFFHSSGHDLYRDRTGYHESGYHSSGGQESGFHSLGRESRYDRSCHGITRSESRGAMYERGRRERDHSLSRVESRVGVLHADRRSGLFHGDHLPSFLYDRDVADRTEGRAGGLVHSSTHDHGLGRPESRSTGMHHSSSAHEHCSSRPESRAEPRSGPESRCAHDRPESRSPALCHEHSRSESRTNLCPEHSRSGLVHSSSSGFETGYQDRMQTSAGLHHSASGHDSLQLSSSDPPEAYPDPPFHSSDPEAFQDRSIFRTLDTAFHAHSSQKLADGSFRYPCPVHSPYRYRCVNGGAEFFSQQVSR